MIHKTAALVKKKKEKHLITLRLWNTYSIISVQEVGFIPGYSIYVFLTALRLKIMIGNQENRFLIT